jgi:glycerate kinase
MLRALGAQPLDAHGRPTPGGGGGLAALDRIELSGLDARLRGARVLLATDVQNPLLGARGAAAVFAPQKGATAQDVQQLEAGLTRLAQVIESATGISVADRPGAGAAGGVGACAVAYLGAEVASGADLVLDLLGFDHLVREADLVLTGEGSWDEQTARSKTPARVARRAAAAGASVGVVAGVLTVSGAELAAAGVDGWCALSQLEPDRSRSLQRAAELVRLAGARVTAAIAARREEQR